MKEGADNGEEKAYESAIKEIEKLINDWIKHKETIIKDKEAKLQQLAQDIDSLEKKYKKLAKRI